MILLDKLVDYYGKPDSPNPASFLEMYESEFRDVADELQEFAATHMIRTRVWRTWPTIAECSEAIKLAKHAVARGATKVAPIENFESWFAGLRRDVENATSKAQIAKALATLEPYVEAQWCFQSRMTELAAIGAKRLKALGHANLEVSHE